MDEDEEFEERIVKAFLGTHLSRLSWQDAIHNVEKDVAGYVTEREAGAIELLMHKAKGEQAGQSAEQVLWRLGGE